MECKLKKGKEVVDRQVELIDTLWNVNVYYMHQIPRQYKELIDTLWNVNSLLFVTKSSTAL